MWSLEGHGTVVTAVTLVEGDLVVTSADDPDSRIRVWDACTGRRLRTWESRQKGVSAVAAMPAPRGADDYEGFGYDDEEFDEGNGTTSSGGVGGGGGGGGGLGRRRNVGDRDITVVSGSSDGSIKVWRYNVLREIPRAVAECAIRDGVS
jgi:WD40 repeat protein